MGNGADSHWVEAHAAFVEGVARRVARRVPAWVISVADLTQVGYVAILECQVDPSMEPAQVAFYLRQRVHGAMLDAARRRNWREADHAHLVVEMVPSRASEGPPAAESGEIIERLDRLRRADELVPLMALLPRRQRRVIELRYLADPGLTQRETGVAMSITQPAVAQLERRALQSLRDALAGGPGNDDDGQAA